MTDMRCHHTTASLLTTGTTEILTPYDIRHCDETDAHSIPAASIIDCHKSLQINCLRIQRTRVRNPRPRSVVSILQ
jgi:hypothetical protein